MSEDGVKILSGGAAFGLIERLRDTFRQQTGLAIGGRFGAVGAMKELLLAGEAADVLILTRAMIDDLAAKGYAAPASIADIGPVETAIAVRAGDPAPCIDGADSLREALRGAGAIYFPDPKLATAGIHFARVREKLGIAQEVAERLRPHPNGATAMAALAAHGAGGAAPIGCTQVTEILAVEGVRLVGPLPAGYELASVYSAAIAQNARNRQAAQALIVMLTGPQAAAVRTAAGFGG